MSLTLNQLTFKERASVKRILASSLVVMDAVKHQADNDWLRENEVKTMLRGLSFIAEEAARNNYDPTFFKKVFLQFLLDEVVANRD